MTVRNVMSHISWRVLSFALSSALCLVLGSCRSSKPATIPDEGFFQPLQSVDRKPAEGSSRVDMNNKTTARQIPVDSLQGVRKKPATRTDNQAAQTKSPRSSQTQARIDSSQIPGKEPLTSAKGLARDARPTTLSLDGIRSGFLAQNYQETVDGCEEILRRGVSKNEEDQYLLMLGTSYYHLKRFDRAAASLKRVITQDGSRLKPDANFVLGQIYKQLGVSQQARRFFEAVISESPGSALATQAREQLQTIAPKK
jgi:tetratricopeptide (TPR) repeat protein